MSANTNSEQIRTRENMDMLTEALEWANGGNPDYAVDVSGHRKVLAAEVWRLRALVQGDMQRIPGPVVIGEEWRPLHGAHWRLARALRAKTAELAETRKAWLRDKNQHQAETDLALTDLAAAERELAGAHAGWAKDREAFMVKLEAAEQRAQEAKALYTQEVGMSWQSRAEALSRELEEAKLRIEMMGLTGVREIPSAKALLDRAEAAEHKLAEAMKVINGLGIYRESAAARHLADIDRIQAAERELAEWKLIATNEPKDNDQRCQLLIAKRKEAEKDRDFWKSQSADWERRCKEDYRKIEKAEARVREVENERDAAENDNKCLLKRNKAHRQAIAELEARLSALDRVAEAAHDLTLHVKEPSFDGVVVVLWSFYDKLITALSALPAGEAKKEGA